jgi:hypothetical protein
LGIEALADVRSLDQHGRHNVCSLLFYDVPFFDVSDPMFLAVIFDAIDKVVEHARSNELLAGAICQQRGMFWFREVRRFSLTDDLKVHPLAVNQIVLVGSCVLRDFLLPVSRLFRSAA